jgi:hypothetical protein
MNTTGIIAAILLNVALFAVYYMGLGQDQPVNSHAPGLAVVNTSHPDSSTPSQLSLSAKESGAATLLIETGSEGSHFKEILDGKEVIDHKEVIDPKDVEPVGEFLDPGGVPIQPQLPNTEFRPPHRKLGISSAPNSANLQPPVVSPESR